MGRASQCRGVGILLAFALSLSLSAPLHAASPSLGAILPRGWQRGTETTITFNGARLGDAQEVLIYYPGITVTGLYLVKRRGGAAPFPMPGYPWTWVVFLISVVIILGLLAAGNPLQAVLGSVVVLAGIPVYYLRRRFA